MKKKILPLIIMLPTISSCYLAGEASKNYVETKNVFKHSGTNTTKGLATGAGVAFLTDIALSPVLSGLNNYLDRKRTLDLAYYCYAEHIKSKPEECVEWAKKRWNWSITYINKETSTKCVNWLLQPFAKGIVKCRSLAFDYASWFKEKPIEKTIYDFKFYWKYAVCMPLKIENYTEEKLKTKHKECIKEARNFAKEYINDIKEELKEYLAKKR